MKRKAPEIEPNTTLEIPAIPPIPTPAHATRSRRNMPNIISSLCVDNNYCFMIYSSHQAKDQP